MQSRPFVQSDCARSFRDKPVQWHQHRQPTATRSSTIPHRDFSIFTVSASLPPSLLPSRLIAMALAVLGHTHTHAGAHVRTAVACGARSAALCAGRGAHARRVGQAEASRDGGGCTVAPVARLAKRDAGNVARDASARSCCAVHIGHEVRAQVIALTLACAFGRSCLFVGALISAPCTAPHPLRRASPCRSRRA